MRIALFTCRSVGIACVASVTDAAIGYPQALVRRIGHPVIWIGRLIDRLDTNLNRPDLSPARRRANGFVAAGLIVALPTLSAMVLERLVKRMLPRWLALPVTALLASTLVAQRSLHDHVLAVARSAEESLPAARHAVSHIVGRDPELLDEAGVLRAATETLAENFSDGIVAPLFWMAAGGLPGAVFYKSANTADSMIGHRTPKHEAFGYAAARLDDLVNLPASRLSALWIILAAATMRGMDAGGALRILRRDATTHRSPNAGWPEAAMAGALGIRLSGPRAYNGVNVDEPWVGDGPATLRPQALYRALALYRRACLIQTLAGLAGLGLLARGLRRH
ncbi:adenosylcobinamide-phosphate synthase CbiB [Komagataeibacter sp. FNDCR2]|uniref:adenosylcobinamide-phosphate synthase CbiB n=1 Tax=Komagataeibacter sp. FNDCR2 TaxID=2878682 RepID=UPI001E4237CF|nr:adenosylcobinamide-phosphate synthase CbiB [Komagataeibacter sp. FNDCR2]MCE2575125.1 adenosylcobinamide-phosphate synthase CbiB [Komagataeibacter sp. FNDCR2]